MRALLALATVAMLAAAGCSDDAPKRSATYGPATNAADAVAVPPVTHMAVQEAYRKLRALGFQVAIPRAFSYRLLSPPLVTAQMPEAGSNAPPGSTVTLTLRRGPTASLALTTVRATVPDVIDMTATQAAALLMSRGLAFHVAKVPPLEASDEDELLDNYRVIAQTVEPGTVVAGTRRPNVGLYVEPAR